MTFTKPLLIALAAAFVAIAPSVARATIVVGVRTETQIVVGADSILGRPDGPTGSFCKLRRIADQPMLFGMAGNLRVRGFFDFGLGTQRFFVQRPADALNPRRRDRAMLKGLAGALRSLSGFRDALDEKGHVTSIAYFAVPKGGVPTVQIREVFRVAGSKNQRLRIEGSDCPPDCGSGAYFLAGIGDILQPIRRNLRDKPEYFETAARQPGGLVVAIRGLIEEAIALSPKTIAPPINIARITARGGVEWIERGPECADQ